MTQVSWAKPLALASTLVVLGSVAYWLEYSHKPKQEETQQEEKKLLKLKDAPNASVLILGGKQTVEIKCLDVSTKLCKPGDNSKWELAQPVKLKADDSNVNSLLSSLNNLASTETIDLSGETAEKKQSLLKEYRLDAALRSTPETRRIEVTDDKGAKEVVILGDTHPIGDSIFALGGTSLQSPDESRVYLVPTFIKAQFDHDLTYWRDKKILTLAAHEIKGFKLNSPKGKQIEGSRKEGQWILKTAATGKEELSGDIENIDSLLTGAAYLTAKGFASENKTSAEGKKALQGAKPFLTLTMETEKAPLTLTLLEKKNPDKLYATVSTLDPVYEVEASAKERLDKSLKDLRLTKLITSMDRFAARRLEFEGSPVGAPALVLIQKDNKWVNEADKKDVTQDKVQTLLDRMTGNRIKDFLQGAAIPTGQESGVKVSVGDDKDAKKRQLLFWAKGDKLFARDLASPRKEAYEVDNALKDALPWSRDFFNPQAPAAAPSQKPGVK